MASKFLLNSESKLDFIKFSIVTDTGHCQIGARSWHSKLLDGHYFIHNNI